MSLVPASSRSIGLPIGLPGATAAVRFVGGTTTGIPTTGTFAVGDFVIAETEGRVYVCTVAGTPGTWVDAGQDPLQAGFGLKAWNYNPQAVQANSVATSQTVYALAIPTIAGVTYTGVKLVTITPGTSTAPTGFFVGLASQANIGAAGSMLAQSGNLNAAAGLTTAGPGLYAFNATYTETVTGLRMVVFFMNGTFAGTNAAFGRTGLGGNFNVAAASQPLNATAGTTVTAFAANGSPIVANYAAAGALNFWAALY